MTLNMFQDWIFQLRKSKQLSMERSFNRYVWKINFSSVDSLVVTNTYYTHEYEKFIIFNM